MYNNNWLSSNLNYNDHHMLSVTLQLCILLTCNIFIEFIVLLKLDSLDLLLDKYLKVIKNFDYNF